MKHYLLLVLLLFTTVFTQAQQDSTTVWITTGNGNIYKLNVNNCSSQLYCSTGKQFLDIALTPNGNLWGNTPDSLYQIYVNGYIRPVGKIPHGNGLVGLNDSTLFIDSMTYLLAVKTADATTSMIGNMNFGADGDLTWMGKDLYMVGQGRLVKITLDDTYSSVQQLDSTLLDSASGAFYTPGLATAYKNGFGYSLIGLPGNVEIYRIDTSNGHYHEICNNPQTGSAYGASSMIFPPNPPPLSITESTINTVRVVAYPNPTKDRLYVELENFDNKASKMEIRCYNYLGDLVKHQFIESSISSVNLNGYCSGIYLIKIQCDSRDIKTFKIIKQ